MIRIAVIGGGPKSLYALLALHDALSGTGFAAAKLSAEGRPSTGFPATAKAQLVVDVYDPLPPGAGSVWRVDQPEILRLNVNAGIVDASSSLSGEDFGRWVNRVVPELAQEKYPPRAVVGRYLREQFQLLSQHGNFAVTHAPFVVTGVERTGPRWHVSGSFGTQSYDEVLVATGHGLAQAIIADPVPGALNTNPLIGDYAAFTCAQIPAGSEVWIRGASLTAYDAALLLTEGRGGTWLRDPDDAGKESQWRYGASGKEPRRITFFSRSASLMDPKSESVPTDIATCLTVHKERLRQWGRQVRESTSTPQLTQAGLWAILLHGAQDCARVMGLEVSALSLWRTALTGISVELGTGTPPLSQPHPAAMALRNSLAVNDLKAPLTTGWLWARVWSGLYAELVSVMDRLPQSTREAGRFARVAHSLEKFTFGPPELTARKLLALFDAGILHVARSQERPPTSAVLIDAVTPAPGALRSAAPGGDPNSEIFAQLLNAGVVSIRPGDRGLLTEADGTCVAQDGTRSESLAALGRPTEGPTLGHDTLNRSLHGEYRLWAQRVAGLALIKTTPRTL
ncbi:FAD/NAD(P)-binding protein [Arthrobacter cryoconiti]|uniref:FAD/NAD(P)-binding protein n=1 Tax=Arthrobacter cryoconiti TaxID=748907 RepID=A0ABV8R0I6_9MICC|nr:FAD/NAD(P)-binding domain-containing protein [Arthrobacter cryoconiti]MCC9068626.1 FAD/NAD(P)-binding protein [Arthrobacter cryoconiti]